MRISSIKTWPIGYTDTNDFNRVKSTLLVEVTVAGGVTGWGEAVTLAPEATMAAQALIDHGFAPMLREAGDLTIEEAWAKMRAHSWWYGEGGLASIALSAIDMALWDILGKERGLPLYALLGGKRVESLPACASSHVNKATLEENVAEVVDFRDQGYLSAKLGMGKKGLSDVGRNPETDIRFVAMLREALGPDFTLMIDAGNGVIWDRETAIQTVRAMGELGIDWIEEPFYPTLIEDYRALKAAVTVPIATGEREYTVSAYRRLIETGTVDILGVDPARSEGVTGFCKVDQICTETGVVMNAHAWSTAVLTAASLHLSLVSPNTRLFELKPFEVSVQHELVDAPIRHQGGHVHVSDRPGIGVEINRTVLERLAWT
ncbi:mandelate racemase/muconate lactonizing enzyme family protein [Xinfangfangia sp. CPCC 101601]|uniref:Mandelate racemase/muconate lactonizing enzyme family protein n=1 Tax=Pseudogemmobacter lacusdianii TaxID=3069608 RepID=A0ABU0W2K7_9RHOB|nr:mandelate racemase/muconate lactonizing enzyme family protein [Xinfangfangia sp. CPCC 101601]MDQ2068247.1 mandelate racemase/muconate lactonizing enzyme family protein [Xinfangfangia sp. CPCC 101601]